VNNLANSMMTLVRALLTAKIQYRTLQKQKM